MVQTLMININGLTNLTSLPMALHIAILAYVPGSPLTSLRAFFNAADLLFEDTAQSMMAGSYLLQAAENLS